jgi:hypothetical protein
MTDSIVAVMQSVSSRAVGAMELPVAVLFATPVGFVG